MNDKFRTIQKYECSLCGAEFFDLIEAELCFDSHAKPLKIIKQEYSFNEKFPICIHVIFEDKRIAQYNLKTLID